MKNYKKIKKTALRKDFKVFKQNRMKLKGFENLYNLRIGDEVIIKYRMRGKYFTFYGILWKKRKVKSKNCVLFIKSFYKKLKIVVYMRFMAYLNSIPTNAVGLVTINKQKYIKTKFNI